MVFMRWQYTYFCLHYLIALPAYLALLPVLSCEHDSLADDKFKILDLMHVHYTYLPLSSRQSRDYHIVYSVEMCMPLTGLSRRTRAISGRQYIHN